jgi:hypothetical protein
VLPCCWARPCSSRAGGQVPGHFALPARCACRHAVPAAAQRGSPASSTSRSQISTPGSKVPTAAKLARSACTPGRKGVGQHACSVSAGRAPHAQGRCVGHCAPHDERGRGACRPCLPDPPGCSPATPRRAGRWAAAAHDAQTGCRRRVRQAPRTPTPAAGGGGSRQREAAAQGSVGRQCGAVARSKHEQAARPTSLVQPADSRAGQPGRPAARQAGGQAGRPAGRQT